MQMIDELPQKPVEGNAKNLESAINYAVEGLAYLVAKIDVLREVVNELGPIRHAENCSIRDNGVDDCDCGYDLKVKALEATK
jgi:hypothetical protein